ncbi:MAG: ABC transporter permease [Caldilineaceae bacterium]|nr:ABC transporter permease [Caldilineaceae bacterium]MDE0069361.1 ABC transporter permease [Caldilineaceae bacterium]
MREYILRRVLQLIPTLFLISIVSFTIIQLPPGDYVTNYVANMTAAGEILSEAEIADLEMQYGLNQPGYMQYVKWITNFVQGDMGLSFYWDRPVNKLIGERLMLTMIMSLLSLLFVYAMAIPIGIYSAVRQYSSFDYLFTFIGFIGLATPNFLLALIFMYIGIKYFGSSAGGLFSPEYLDAPWSVGRVWDMLKHMGLPVVIVGTAGTAATIRVMRATTLDELGRPYVETARAKGLREGPLTMKYPVRVALNPILSTIGWLLPEIVSGTVLVALVLNLPTTGPLLWRALMAQDLYLAASFIMILSTLTLIGTLLSDILLAWVDPRIRYGERGST